MKKLNIWVGCLALFAGTIHAQEDSVKVKITRDSMAVPQQVQTHETIETQTKTTQVIHDTVVREPAKPKREEPPMRYGEFGIRFLPTVTYLSFNTMSGGAVQATADVNYGYGVFLGLNFTHNIGIVAEVDYLDIFQKYKDQELERQVHLNYINIPVMLSLNTDKRRPVNLNLVVGPQFGINVGSSVNATDNGNGSTVTTTVAAKQGDVGIAYGAGLEFALNRMHTIRLDLGFRGMYGFVDISGGNVNADAYTVTVSGSRKAYGGYAGFTILW